MSTTLYQSRNKKLPAKPSATKRFFRALGVLLLLLAVCTGIGYGCYAWSNHSKVKALQAEAVQAMEEGRGFGDRERGRERREQVKALPAAYQQEYQKGMREMRQARQEKRLREYLALDKEGRRQELLRQIAEGEKRRAEWEKRRAERQAEQAKNGGNSSNQNGSGGNGPNGQANGGQGNGGQGGGGGGQRGLAARLDNSTPQMRAGMAQYVRDMNQVRREEGLPPWRGGRFGRR